MRLASLPPAIALVAVTLLGLTGCFGSDPTLVPEPEPSTTPVFASDEEALAAAEEAYAAYIAVSDQILIDGGANPERLLEVATQEVYETQLEGYELAREAGHRSTGGTTFDSAVLQQFGDDFVVVYLCRDISLVDILDGTGNSVVSPDRVDRRPLEVSFEVRNEQTPRLVLASSDDWSGLESCG